MKLEDIGFYTLSNERAKKTSMTSPLHRCELLLTDRCNFHCVYCRGLKNGGDLDLGEAKRILEYWISNGLQNIRFSGGEPTLYPDLFELVDICKKAEVEHIAISTNGSSRKVYYVELIKSGVNDFSISLDACCSTVGDTMSGVKGFYDHIIANIEALSQLTYVTVGVVYNEKNEKEIYSIIQLAHDLGVSDIRIIPSAQYNKPLKIEVDSPIIESHPILKYRMGNHRLARGLSGGDTGKCKLVLDDMAVWNSYHYPCIIYLREGGTPIGQIGENTREERFEWYKHHNSYEDKICLHNCLDVCIEYNNRCNEYEKSKDSED